MKRISPIYILLLSGFLIFSPRVNAQATIEKWSPICLDSVIHCSEGSPNENCNPVGNDAVHTSSHWGHRAQIDARSVKIPADQQVIFLECFQPILDHDPWTALDDNNDGEADWYCTSGSQESDKLLFCGGQGDSASCDMRAQMNANPNVNYGLAGDTVNTPWGRWEADETYGHFFRADANLSSAAPFSRITSTNQLKTDASGKLNASYFEAQSWSTLGPRKYILYYTSAAPLAPAPTAAEGIGGQQQATLSFAEVRDVIENTCAFSNVAWDPYGRVFDALSLEPIPSVPVTLLEQNPQGIFDAGYALNRNRLIVNPFATGTDGGFVFFVEDGNYQLRPTVQGYTHPLTTSWTPDGNTNKIYSDFYLSDSQPIQQRGAIEHRDIPLMPADNVGKSYDLVVISNESMTDAKGNLILKGRLSHPFSEVIIDICRNDHGVEVCSDQTIYGLGSGGADREGKYEVTIPQSKLKPAEYFKRSFRKINLLTMTSDSTAPVSGSHSLAPIPSYLEGYAYDKNGTLITDGYVGLYLVSLPIVQELAPIGENGYFKITSERIPTQPYILRYLKKDGNSYTIIDEVTISEFLDQNKDFHTIEEIALYKPVTAQNNPRRSVTPEFIPEQKISPIGKATPAKTAEQVETTEETSQRNPMYLVGAILLLLIGGAGAFLAIHLYKKRKEE